jgi:hypothetical protein
MAKFRVLGPFKVPLVKNRGGRHIDTASLNEFWEQTDCRNDRGCYVFGVRSGRGSPPYYVGKATKGFGQECFSPHKLNKYNQALTKTRRGTAIMYFAWLDQERGKPNSRAISDLEEYLIDTALNRNDALENIQGTQKAELVIVGVLRSGKGKPSQASKRFRAMMGI